MSTSLKMVSLTGTDDATSLADLNALGEEFPFVEWALLYVPGKEGQARNPTQAWRETFFAHRPRGGNAVHLCGALAFEQLQTGILPPEILKTDRLQLNINARRPDFSDAEVLRIYDRALTLGPDLILQRHEYTFHVIDWFLQGLKAADRARVTVLLDESRGKGIQPETWSVPISLKDVTLGFAGGLGPDNVAAVAAKIEQLKVPYWLDMESGIRTDNSFDKVKARAVLVATAPLVAQRAGRADWAQSLPAWPL